MRSWGARWRTGMACPHRRGRRSWPWCPLAASRWSWSRTPGPCPWRRGTSPTSPSWWTTWTPRRRRSGRQGWIPSWHRRKRSCRASSEDCKTGSLPGHPGSRLSCCRCCKGKRAFTFGWKPFCIADGLAEQFPRYPDEQARARYVYNKIGEPAVGVETEQAEHGAAHGGAYNADDDITEKPAVGIHQLPGNPAHQRTHDQGAQQMKHCQNLLSSIFNIFPDPVNRSDFFLADFPAVFNFLLGNRVHHRHHHRGHILAQLLGEGLHGLVGPSLNRVAEGVILFCRVGV